MSDTLETDLLYLKQRPSLVQMTTHFNQFVKKCQQLERERDEAIIKYATEATEHMLAVNKICGERDEARIGWDQEITFNQCQLKDAKQLADRLTALELHSTSELARLEHERNEALSQIVQAECRAERFCQERDELIDKNKKLNEEVDDLIRQRPLLIEDFKRERDEARDELKIALEQWELCLEQIAKLKNDK